jgi:hypothetical protein
MLRRITIKCSRYLSETCSQHVHRDDRNALLITNYISRGIRLYQYCRHPFGYHITNELPTIDLRPLKSNKHIAGLSLAAIQNQSGNIGIRLDWKMECLLQNGR